MKTIAEQMRELVEASMDEVDKIAAKVYADLIEEIRKYAKCGETNYTWREGVNYWRGGKRDHEVWCQVQNMLIADGFNTDSERSGGALRIYW